MGLLLLHVWSAVVFSNVWVYLYNALECSKHYQSIVEENSETVYV